jgi:hypothetical protein
MEFKKNAWRDRMVTQTEAVRLLVTPEHKDHLLTAATVLDIERLAFISGIHGPLQERAEGVGVAGGHI